MHLAEARSDTALRWAPTARPFTRCRPCRQARRLCCRASATPAFGQSFSQLEEATSALRKAPFSEKYEYSKDVLAAMSALKEAGALRLWGSAASVERRNVVLWELKRVGIKEPSVIGVSSIRAAPAYVSLVRGSAGHAQQLYSARSHAVGHSHKVSTQGCTLLLSGPVRSGTKRAGRSSAVC